MMAAKNSSLVSIGQQLLVAGSLRFVQLLSLFAAIGELTHISMQVEYGMIKPAINWNEGLTNWQWSPWSHVYGGRAEGNISNSMSKPLWSGASR
jgi:hypothetical protein